MSIASSSISLSDSSRYSRIGTWTFCFTVSEENSAPCWNSTPQRRSTSATRIGDRALSRSWPNTSIVPARLRHQAEDGARQHRLARAGGADEAEDLAAIDIEVEALHDQSVAEADLEVADADDRLALRRLPVGLAGLFGWVSDRHARPQYLIAAKNMANRPSTTMTMKIDFTTEDVTCRPSDSAEPFDRQALDARR